MWVERINVDACNQLDRLNYYLFIFGGTVCDHLFVLLSSLLPASLGQSRSSIPNLYKLIIAL